MISTASTAGIGFVLEEIVGESSTYCSVKCASNIKCNGANYSSTNKTCISLHVEDVLDDWVMEDDSSYLCINCEPGPTGE